MLHSCLVLTKSVDQEATYSCRIFFTDSAPAWVWHTLVDSKQDAMHNQKKLAHVVPFFHPRAAGTMQPCRFPVHTSTLRPGMIAQINVYSTSWFSHEALPRKNTVKTGTRQNNNSFFEQNDYMWNCRMCANHTHTHTHTRQPGPGQDEWQKTLPRTLYIYIYVNANVIFS